MGIMAPLVASVTECDDIGFFIGSSIGDMDNMVNFEAGRGREPDGIFVEKAACLSAILAGKVVAAENAPRDCGSVAAPNVMALPFDGVEFTAKRFVAAVRQRTMTPAAGVGIGAVVGHRVTERSIGSFVIK